MFNYFNKFINVLILFKIIFLFDTVFGQNEMQITIEFTIDLVQETTHPTIQLSPVISPDNRWLAYATSRNGNFDIYILSLTDGSLSQITTHRADDMFPCWAPDGKSLAFVSQRKDAAGDIWIVNLRQKKGIISVKSPPQQLTTYLGFDGYPTFSPNGEYLAFVSDRTGHDNIWLHEIKTHKEYQLTFNGGTHPSWNPSGELLVFTSFRNNSKGHGDIYVLDVSETFTQIRSNQWPDTQGVRAIHAVTHGTALEGFPCWSPDGYSLTFIRHDIDSDGDGLLTPEDNSTIWVAKCDSAQIEYYSNSDTLAGDFDRFFNLNLIESEIPLTSEGHRVFKPNWGNNDRIYYSSNQGGNLDIWSMHSTGYLPHLATAEEQYEAAEQQFPLPMSMTIETLGPLYLNWDPSSLTSVDSMALLDRALAFQRVLDFHGNDIYYFICMSSVD